MRTFQFQNVTPRIRAYSPSAGLAALERAFLPEDQYYLFGALRHNRRVLADLERTPVRGSHIGSLLNFPLVAVYSNIARQVSTGENSPDTLDPELAALFRRYVTEPNSAARQFAVKLLAAVRRARFPVVNRTAPPYEVATLLTYTAGLDLVSVLIERRNSLQAWVTQLESGEEGDHAEELDRVSSEISAAEQERLEAAAALAEANRAASNIRPLRGRR